MGLAINHKTVYQYTSAVFVEPQYLYFYPAHRNYLKVIDFQINVEPEPSGLSFRLDPENNPYHQCWFHESLNQLVIEVEMKLETNEFNPFNFFIERAAKSSDLEALDRYLSKEPLKEEIIEWIHDIADRSENNPLTLLTYLCKEIHSGWEHTLRYEPTLMDISDCFNQKKGSCRDLSWMMIQMCRSLQIPARFVSGYAYNPELEEGHELHAWVECWLPGAGWIGLDPGTGLLATHQYIPVAVSYLPEKTFPVQGSFRGNAGAELSFEVSIRID